MIQPPSLGTNDYIMPFSYDKVHYKCLLDPRGETQQSFMTRASEVNKNSKVLKLRHKYHPAQAVEAAVRIV